MAKEYIISSYMEDYLAMYESTDFRLEALDLKVAGTFKRDKSIKGMFNGAEIGIFTAITSGKRYAIFTDHSAREISEVYWTAPVGGFDDFDQPIGNEIIDGKTIHGPWALMCIHSYKVHGMGLGVGLGQKYRKQADGRWLLIEGN